MDLLAFLDPDTVKNWIEAGGYLMLFGLLFACGLGLPLPEDIPLLVAGWMIASGKMHLAWAAVCAWCGIIGGDLVLYHFGKKFGLEITRVPFIGKHVTRAQMSGRRNCLSITGYGLLPLAGCSPAFAAPWSLPRGRYATI